MATILSVQKKYSSITTLDFSILLSHTLKKSKEFIFAHPEYPLSLKEKFLLYFYIKKYQRGIPIAYITHHKEFFGLDFYVNKHTLIPRPETELIVEGVLKNLKLNNKQNSVLIDVGTGSGCIPIAILKTLQPENIETTAIDISRQALRIAKKNAKYHNVDITFLHGDLLNPIIPSYNLKANSYKLIITANLPYLTKEQFNKEPSIQHEPYHALVADNHGLALYDHLLEQIKLLQNSSSAIHAFFEIDPAQTDAIVLLVKKYFPRASVEIKKDLANRDRLVVITIN